MTSKEIFSHAISEAAKAGRYDHPSLVAKACELTRELRDSGTTPEGTLKSVKQILGQTTGPSDRLKQEIVTNCIETFFET